MNLELSAILDKYPLSVQGTVGPVGQGFEGGKIPLDLKLAAIKELTINLKGNLENLVAEPGVDLDLEIDEFSPRKLVAALGQSFPLATSDPKALDRVALKAHVMANAKQAAVTNGKMDIDESKLNFSMQASQFSRPAVKFDLNLDQINVDRYLPPKSETAPKSEEAAPGTPKKTDYAPLRRLILDGQLKIGQLIASKAKIQDLLMRVTAKDGIINLDPLKMNLYQGKVAGKASLDVTKDVPKSSVNLLVDKVKVGPLLKDVLEVDVLEGAAEADVALAMEGDEPALIKKTLNGEGVVMFRDGAIVGIDLANMVRNVQSAFGLGEKPKERPRTDFTELNAPFTIKNGLVNTPNTSLRSPLLRIIAIGDAHLVNETIDFRVEPKAVATIKGQGDETQRSGIMVPVVVSGTFSAPKFRPDISAATKQEIKQKVLESKEAQKVMEKEEVKKIIEKKETKDLLKGVLGN
jgi:AsmA protein